MSGETSSSSDGGTCDDKPSKSCDADVDSAGIDDDKLCCSICLERFQIADQVAWSPNPNCQHVYHHACIRDWLLRKTACPYCRETLLPIDNVMNMGTATTATATMENDGQNEEIQHQEQSDQSLEQQSDQSSDDGDMRSVALTAPNRSFDNEEDDDIEANNSISAEETAPSPQQQSPPPTAKHPPPSTSSPTKPLSKQEHHLQCSKQRSKRIKTTYFCVECGLVDLADRGGVSKSSSV